MQGTLNQLYPIKKGLIEYIIFLNMVVQLLNLIRITFSTINFLSQQPIKWPYF